MKCLHVAPPPFFRPIKSVHIILNFVNIMLEISLITVIYKRIGKFWYITQSELNSCKWRRFHSKSSRIHALTTYIM
jgi:hypothetical protein